MNKTIKDNWTKALISGDYIQGTGRLCRAEEEQDTFCCLGVLIDIEYDGDWELSPLKIGYIIKIDGITKTTHLEKRFQNKCGITDTQQNKLISLNDMRQSFKQIANWIDNNL